MVTSSAVVGSSAMSSRGSQASAIAISARWRMPPHSWCGYSLSRRSGSGMPTRVEQVAGHRLGGPARHPAVPLEHLGDLQRRPARPGSASDSGSWKIIAMSRPRRSRIAFASSASRSVPSKLAWPSTLLPRLGSRPMIASEVTDLPQPDSPTRPTVWPGRDVEADAVDGAERLLALPGEGDAQVAHRQQRLVAGAVVGGGVAVAVIGASPPGLRVEGLAQRLAHQGEAERDDDDAQRRVDREVRVVVDVLPAPRPSIWPHSGAVVVGVAQAEEGQRGGVDDRRWRAPGWPAR